MWKVGLGQILPLSAYKGHFWSQLVQSRRDILNFTPALTQLIQGVLPGQTGEVGSNIAAGGALNITANKAKYVANETLNAGDGK